MRFVLFISLFALLAQADVAQYNRGEMLFFANACSSCHGPGAEGSVTYPKLANKKQSYLRKKLLNFKAGKALSVSQQMMAQFTQKLSEKDIDDLTYFLSHHKKVEIDDVSDAYLGGVGS